MPRNLAANLHTLHSVWHPFRCRGRGELQAVAALAKIRILRSQVLPSCIAVELRKSCARVATKFFEPDDLWGVSCVVTCATARPGPAYWPKIVRS